MYKITYIMPVYNTKPELIDRCIESILLENKTTTLIIVDDSSDNNETIQYLNKLNLDTTSSKEELYSKYDKVLRL